MDYQNITLVQIGYLQADISRERISHKISRELAMAALVGSIYDGFGSQAQMLEAERLQAAEVNLWQSDTIAL
jgi:hypothetical protein